MSMFDSRNPALPRRSSRRHAALAGLAVLLAASASLYATEGSQKAYAATLVSCQTSGTLSESSPVSAQGGNSTPDITQQSSTCTDSTGGINGVTVTGANFGLNSSDTDSGTCADFVLPGEQLTVTWTLSDGTTDTSVLQAGTPADGSGTISTATLTGSVVSGRFAGTDSSSPTPITIALTNNDQSAVSDCAANGASSETGTATLTIGA